MSTATLPDRPRFAFDLAACVVADVETYPGRWCVGFLGPGCPAGSGRIVDGDREELRRTLTALARRGVILATYNGVGFDIPVIRAILKGFDPYAIACGIINGTPLPIDLRTLPVLPVDHIDLAARLRRGGRFPSLKKVAAYLGRPTLRELPYAPGSILDDDQWAQVKSYNAIDLGHTQALLDRFAPELQALAALSEQQDQDLRSVPTPRVVEGVFLDAYRRECGVEPTRPATPHEVVYRAVPGVVRPRTTEAAAWYDRVVNTPLPIIDQADRPHTEVPRARFALGDLTISVGAGGLHSVDPPGVHYETRETRLVSVDVASYYPSLMAAKGIGPGAYGDVGAATYRGILKRRLDVKRRAKAIDDPAERERLDVQATALKLVLNSTFGKLGDPYSSLFDPAAFLAVTLTGQLMLIDLIERLIAVGVRIISANTDGLFLTVGREDRRWRGVLKGWEADTGMSLEVDPLKRLAILASNRFAVLDRSDKVKRRGAGVKGDFSPVAAPNNLVVADAVVEALLKDVPPERTILTCDDPVRFCSVTQRSGKVTAAVLVDTGDGSEAELPKVARWYHARDSARRIVHRFEGGRHTTPANAVGVNLALDVVAGSLPDDIDRSWYIGQARKVIQSLPGYHHRSPKRLQGHPDAADLVRRGLAPVPKWAGKAQPKGADRSIPTYLWDWSSYVTFGTYTGPGVGVLAIDIDDAAKFHRWVARENQISLLEDHWRDLDGCLVSCRDDATPERVRCGQARGKLLFRLAGDATHPLTRVPIAKWLKTRGFEVFYGRGMPTVLGAHPDGSRYRLDGVLSEAPDWLVEAISPPMRTVPWSPPPGPGPHIASPNGDGHDPEPVGDGEADDRLESLLARAAILVPELADGAIGWHDWQLDGGRTAKRGRCPFEHGSGVNGPTDLLLGFNREGRPFLRCVHQTCERSRAVNLRLKREAAGAGADPTIEADPAGRDDPDARALDANLAQLPRTDTGNAERLAARFGRNLRYIGRWRKPLVWDGMRWGMDETCGAMRLAKRTARLIYAEAATIADNKESNLHAAWSRQSERKQLRDAMLALAYAEEGIAIAYETLDPDPWLLNLLNGTLDLKTGALRPHRREDLITQLCPVEFDPDADCPLWESTLELIFGGDDELVAYWQRLCGYILTGSTREQILPILHGAGDNGKSTLSNALIELLGPDYAMSAKPDLLMVKRHYGHPTELASLFRKRLVVAIETGEDRRIDETLVKHLTGSDLIQTRRMREDEWGFKPTHKLLLCTNHAPVIRGTDHAIWRRIAKIPFTVVIPPAVKDKTVPVRLVREHAGILAWCVRGCLDWQRRTTLDPPQRVILATQDYREGQDILGRFLASECERGENFQVRAGVLYKEYRQWCEKLGEYPMSLTAFGLRMANQGIEKDETKGISYKGIRLQPGDF